MSSDYYMCPCATTCVRVLHVCPLTTIHLSSYYYICVLMLRYMYPHTAIYVS